MLPVVKDLTKETDEETHRGKELPTRKVHRAATQQESTHVMLSGSSPNLNP